MQIAPSGQHKLSGDLLKTLPLIINICYFEALPGIHLNTFINWELYE